MLSIAAIALIIIAYSLIGIFLSGLYIGLDFHETGGSLEAGLASVVLIIWPVALLVGLVTLILLGSFRLANRAWFLGRTVGFDLAEALEI